MTGTCLQFKTSDTSYQLPKMGDKKAKTKGKNEIVLEEVDNLQMSRGEKEETQLNFKKLRNIVVYDESGNEVKFGDIYKEQKTIIVFTRVCVYTDKQTKKLL